MVKVTFNTYIKENCSAIVFDAPLVLMDYISLWERQIAFIAQDLAGKHSSVQGQFFRNRALIIKMLGFNPGSGVIDFDGPFFTMPEDHLISALSSLLYVGEVSLDEAGNSIQETIHNFNTTPEYTHLLNINPSYLNILQVLKSCQVKIACLCSNPFTPDETFIQETSASAYIDSYIACNKVRNDITTALLEENLQIAKEDMVVITTKNRLPFHPDLVNLDLISYTVSDQAESPKMINSLDMIQICT